MRKKGSPIRKANISFEKRIEGLKKEIEILESLIPLRDYFHPVKHSMNSYLVELRKIIAIDLLEKGLNFMEIGRAIGKDQSTVRHLVEIRSEEYIETEVLNNYKEWMKNMDYPNTYPIRIPSEFSANGETSRIGYRLVKKIPKRS